MYLVKQEEKEKKKQHWKTFLLFLLFLLRIIEKTVIKKFRDVVLFFSNI